MDIPEMRGFYPANLFNLVGSEGNHNTRVDVEEALERDISAHFAKEDE
ncbi:MAG: hypothetical protein LN413_00630 [Candidatus Thermoplasmatota archaeon]|nr:hypothetical protein [Candidatus Thermoplasmatota archaeon]